MPKDSDSSNGWSGWFKWIVGAVIAVMAAGGGIVALIDYFFNPKQEPSPPPTPTETVSQPSEMNAEIIYRFQEIRNFLYKEPMTNRDLYNATKRIDAHGVGVSKEYKDTLLRSLLFDLERTASAEKKSYIQKIRDLFDELSKIGPEAPFQDSEYAATEKVQTARDKLEQIERWWQRFRD